MSQCEKCGRLSAYLDRELGPAEMAAMEHHIAECPVCEAALRELQSVTTLLHGAAIPALSPAGLARLHERVNEWNRRGAERLAGVLSALAACLAIVSALSLIRASNAAPTPQPWETAAVRISDDGSAANSRENAMAVMMVADLSQGGAEGE